MALDAIVRTIWSRSRHLVPSDLRDDCEQEAKLALWRARPRMECLPVEDQPRYAARCVQRAVFRVLHVEVRERQQCVSLEMLQLGLASPEPASERDTAAEALARLPVRDQIGWPDLAAAVAGLPEPKQDLLDLVVREDLPDQELAAVLGTAVGAAKMQRHRVLAAIRRVVLPGSNGEA